MGLSCASFKSTGKCCTLVRIDSEKRRCACNEIKLPEESDTDRDIRDTPARDARYAAPQPEQ